MLRFLFILIILFILVPLFMFVLRVLGAFFRPVGRQDGNKSGTSGQQSGSRFTWPKKNKKVFEQSEGEYVDFEEVKEDEKKEDLN